MISKNKIEFAVLRILEKFLILIGIKNARRFGKILAFLIYYFIPIRKKTVLRNLSIAFPNFSKKQIQSIAYKNYFSLILTLIEFMYLSKFSSEELNSLMRCDELDLIREKFNLNKGIILLTAHFGNWEVGAASIGSQIGMQINVLVKDQSNPLVTEWLNEKREVFGNKVIKLGASVRDIYKAIKNGGLVGMVGDQRGPRESPRVKFFGRETAVYSGTAAIALKTGAPIITAIGQRQKDFSYKLFIKEIKTDNLIGSDEEKILQINQAYMDMLEKRIRETPEQWFWMHNIWKY